MRVSADDNNPCPSIVWIFLNGKPIELAVAADDEEGWVDLYIRDRHNRPVMDVPHLGVDIKPLVVRAYGCVKIVARDGDPPKAWLEPIRDYEGNYMDVFIPTDYQSDYWYS